MDEARGKGWLIAIGAGVLLAIALVGGGRMIDPWLGGGLWLATCALLVRGITWLSKKRLRQALASLTILLLAFVFWNHTARQPRIRVDALELQRLPSSAQPGLVELVVRNAGDEPASIVVFPAAYLAPLYRDAQDLVANRVEDELQKRLEQAGPVPSTGTTRVENNQTTLVNATVPFSERVWQFGRGELTLIVAARIRYRDRLFNREKVICQFANPRAGNWVSCPFLNN